MAADRELIWVIDDDADMRKALRMMLLQEEFEVRVVESARAFLDHYTEPAARECAIVDLKMPDMSGIELVEAIRRRGLNLPVVILTGHGTIPQTVEAMRLGAVDVLEKPAPREALLARVRQAIEAGVRLRSQRAEANQVQQRLSTLTPRERELLDLIVAGRANKQIAGDLFISEKTVANHRARLMDKMEALNAADLARMVVAARDAAQPSE